MNRTRTVGLALLLAAGIQLWFTTRVGGYVLQIVSALLTMGLAFAAVAALSDRSTGSLEVAALTIAIEPGSPTTRP